MSVPALARVHDPLLLCLNLQHCFMDPGSAFYVPRAAQVVINAQSCISWSRRIGMPIVHIHHAIGGDYSKPIAGCGPLSNEPLLHKVSATFFEDEEFTRRVFANDNLSAIVLGFSGIGDCLRLAISAERRGARLVFVSDAIGSPQIGGDHLLFDEIVAAILEQFGSSVKTGELLKLEAGWENHNVARH